MGPYCSCVELLGGLLMYSWCTEYQFSLWWSLVPSDLTTHVTGARPGPCSSCDLPSCPKTLAMPFLLSGVLLPHFCHTQASLALSARLAYEVATPGSGEATLRAVPWLTAKVYSSVPLTRVGYLHSKEGKEVLKGPKEQWQRKEKEGRNQISWSVRLVTRFSDLSSKSSPTLSSFRILEKFLNLSPYL